MIKFYFVFLFIGLLSNIINPIQSKFTYLIDVLTCSRFLIYYFAVRVILVDVDNIKLLICFEKFCKFFITITFMVAVHDILLNPWFPQGGFRFFMNALQLYFPHPSYMAVGCMICLAVFIASSGLTEEKEKSNKVYIAMSVLLMIFTLRSKAVASAVIIIMLGFLLTKMKVKSKLFLLFGGGVFAAIFGWQQVMFYYIENADIAVRARLMIDSIKLANKNFPFGTGFATFGSNMAATKYSKLYLKLGYNNLHGGSEKDPSFLSDTFWPTVIGQTGWIGLIAFVGILLCFILIIFKIQKKNLYFYWASLSILVYELISSTSESSFFNPSTCLLFFLLGLIVNIAHNAKYVEVRGTAENEDLQRKELISCQKN